MKKEKTVSQSASEPVSESGPQAGPDPTHQPTGSPAHDPILRFLSAYNMKPPSPLGLRVARLCDQWFHGLHHIDDPAAIDWSNNHLIEIRLRRGTLATYDFNDLTRLVFLAHDHCIRAQISAIAGPMSGLIVRFDPCDPAAVNMSDGHPTLAAAVEAHRIAHPLVPFLP